MAQSQRMPMRRGLAIVLYGGWLLLFNPERHRPDFPLSEWKKLREYDTAYVCEQGRREEVLTALGKDGKKADAGRMTPAEAELRYRCERAEHVPER